MILHSLIHKGKKDTYIYITKSRFRIYIYNERRFREYYDSEIGLATKWGRPSPHVSICGELNESDPDSFIYAVEYKPSRMHIREGSLIKVIIPNPKTSSFYLFEYDDSTTDLIKIDGTDDDSCIVSVKRDEEKVTIDCKNNSEIRVSSSIDPDETPLEVLHGLHIVYNIPKKYEHIDFFIHCFLNNKHIETKIVRKIEMEYSHLPDAPHLKLEDGCVFISWTTSHPFDRYTLIRRQPGKPCPWNVVGVMLETPPLYDCNLDEDPKGGFYYRIIGHENGRDVVGKEAFIHVPDKALLTEKPHGRSTTNYQLTHTWAGPTIIKC